MKRNMWIDIKFYTAVAGIMASGVSLSAMTVELSPGSLQQQIEDVRLSADHLLTLCGSADVRDLQLLQSLPDRVEEVDMSGLEIKPYTYSTGSYMGRKSFGAGEIPPCMLMGTKVCRFQWPVGVTTVGESAFAATRLTEIVIPMGVAQVGSHAFADCRSLVSVQGKGVSGWGASAFKGCMELTGFEFGPEVDAVPESMFEGCVKYGSGPSGNISTIGSRAYRATALEAVDLTGVASVGAYAFADIPALREITLGTSRPIDIGEGAFYGDSGLAMLPVWNGSAPDVMFSNAGSGAYQLVDNEEIGEGAYAGNHSLKTLQLGPNVRSIASHAFRNASSLQEVIATGRKDDMPQLQADSFSGLENDEGRYDINLVVDSISGEAWSNHPVWSRFNLTVDTGVVGAVTESFTVSVSRTDARVVVRASVPIDRIRVYSPDGMVLADASPRTADAVIDGIVREGVLVVQVNAAGKSKIVKIAG